MKREKPFIYPFKTLGGFYFYDVNMDKIVTVKENVYLFLTKQQSEELEPGEDIKSDIFLLKQNGFLKSTKVKELEHPDTDILPSILKNNVNHIILQVTQGCNLRCAYCTYSGHYNHREHTYKRMSWEMAKDAIDFLIDHSSSSEDLILGFYGGEPLLEFGLIKKCIQYILQEAEGKKVSFSLTTNATLLTDEAIETFEKYSVDLMISLDGPQEIHDRNRKYSNGKGTFETVIKNVRHIKDKYPDYFKHIRFNVVVDLQSDLNVLRDFIAESDLINRMNAKISTVSNIYMKNKFDDMPERVFIQRNMDFMRLYLQKLGKISDDEICLFDAEYEDIKAKLYDSAVRRSEVPQKAHPGGPCTPGRKRIFMNIDGDFYPCERVSENSKVMKLGNLYTGFDVKKISNIINVAKITEKNCKNCWAFNYCNQCAAFADDMQQLSAKKRLENCKITKSTVENMFKNYCMLKELGHSFDNTWG